MKARTRNSSLTNALQILKSFNLEQPEWSLREIAANQNISISTAHRLLKTLEEENFIIHEKQHYKLGTSILRFTNIFIDDLDVLKGMTPYLKSLTKKTGQSAHIAMLSGKEVLYLKKEDGLIQVPLKSHIGRRNPFYATSSGQVIVAFMPDDQRLALLQQTQFINFTTATLTTIEQYERSFQQIRQQGVAISREELHMQFMSIAAPIFNKQNEVVASVSIAGKVKALQPNEKTFTLSVKQTAEMITQFIQKYRAGSPNDIFNK